MANAAYKASQPDQAIELPPLGLLNRPPPEDCGNWVGILREQPNVEEILKELTMLQLELLHSSWIFNARHEQFEPEGDDWNIWMFIAGRGAGKTRAGAEWVVHNAMVKNLKRQALVAPTHADLVNVMIEGQSGILSVCPDAKYDASKKRITFPNGNVAYGFSAESPNRLRGPQFHAAWCDELCAWQYDTETWDMLRFAVRLGKKPRYFISTTPKATDLYKKIKKLSRTKITRCSTYANSENLAQDFIRDVEEDYKDTRLGRQELLGEDIEDSDQALWTRDMFLRAERTPKGGFGSIVIGFDPAVTSKKKSDEYGIVVAGMYDKNKAMVIADRTMKGTPEQVGKEIVAAYYLYNADYIVAEANNGGEWISTVISQIDPKVIVKLVHARRSKRERAEPVSMLYEQGRVFHLGTYGKLEDQMCTWDKTTKESPDRIDALVYAIQYLLLDKERKIDYCKAMR